MSGHSKRQTRNYPIHITLSAVYTGLLIVVGTALITFNFTRARSAALRKADHELEMLAAHLETKVSELYGPAQNLVDLASKMRLSTNDSPVERQRELGALTEALRLQQEIESIFVGSGDGSFALVRSLRGREAARKAINAPDEAVYARQSISRAGSEEVGEEVVFYGGDDQVVERRVEVWSGFDPRERTWYRMAMAEDAQIATGAYVFFTTREVGVTIARRLAGGDGVVGVDLSLSDLSAGLADNTVTASSRLMLLDRAGRVIASSDPVFLTDLAQNLGADSVDLPLLSELQHPVYRVLSSVLGTNISPGKRTLYADGRTWLAWVSALPVRAEGEISLVTLLPRDELLVGVVRTRNQSLLISLLMLVVTIALSVLISRHISASLRTLAREAQHIRELRFDTRITTSSRIREVADLAATMQVMKGSIQQFLAISHALSAEKNHDRLLEMILQEARSVCRADGGAILLRTDDWQSLEVSILHNVAAGEFFGGPDRDKPPHDLVPVDGDREGTASLLVERRTVDAATVIRVDDLEVLELQTALEITKRHFDRDGAPARSLLSAPLLTQQGEVIGVLQLVNARSPDGTLTPFSNETIPFIEALCSDAAVALDNRRLLKAHKDLLESFIHVLAGAIDAKSPYTHGHCQRVPEIARLIAEAAHQQKDGVFSGFRLSDDEWYELHLASWLHDCGKVTTPEYVVDKATKLETLANRIHEIRTRFEVVWRDAEIDYWKTLASGGDESETEARLQQRRVALSDDFDFIARCNLGDNPLSPEDVARIEEVGARTWLRHFNDSLGLSHLEKMQRPRGAPTRLPAVETLLADKTEHIVHRGEGQRPFGDEPHAFKMDIPEHLYNRGELYNLKVSRGTLTTEERFKINEHIIQTLRMLERLPFPRELKRVPRWAGSHHEKLDGTGYPCRFTEKDLSIPERIMAVADVFEALTAADRPYMTPRKLSGAINIMRSMATSGHLCPEVFELLLKSGVHRVYAERYLREDQIDDVDVTRVLESLA